jgi:hypothetical protein
MANYFKTISTPAGTSPVADSSTDVLTLDSANNSVKVMGTSSSDTVDFTVCLPTKRIFFSTDFAYQPYKDYIVAASGSGATWSLDIVCELVSGTYYQGILRINPATTTNNYSKVSTGLGTLALGVGKATHNVMLKSPAAISDATDNYTLIAGFFNNYTGATDGCYFYYNHATNTDWVVTTVKDGVATTTDTNVALTASTWYKLSVVVNAAATSVGFYINNSLVATHTTNIPSGVGDALGAGIYTERLSTGGTARMTLLDYMDTEIILTTER